MMYKSLKKRMVFSVSDHWNFIFSRSLDFLATNLNHQPSWRPGGIFRAIWSQESLSDLPKKVDPWSCVVSLQENKMAKNRRFLAMSRMKQWERKLDGWSLMLTYPFLGPQNPIILKRRLGSGCGLLGLGLARLGCEAVSGHDWSTYTPLTYPP